LQSLEVKHYCSSLVGETILIRLQRTLAHISDEKSAPRITCTNCRIIDVCKIIPCGFRIWIEFVFCKPIMDLNCPRYNESCEVVTVILYVSYVYVLKLLSRHDVPFKLKPTQCHYMQCYF